MTNLDGPPEVPLPEHSRALLLAEGVSGLSQGELLSHMNSATVTVGVDMETPGALLCGKTLLTTLRRMPCQLALDTTGLATEVINELVDRAQEIDPVRGINLRAAHEMAAQVYMYVGVNGPSNAIRLIPEGHGGHVVGVGGPQVRPVRDPSALGSVYTAALGAGEAFKTVAGVRSQKRIDHDHLSFCPVSLRTDLDRAPDLPTGVTIDLALVGLGAVGTGHALILSELPWRGRVALVDRQRFDLENLGTYSIGTAADAKRRPWKVDLAAGILGQYETTALPLSVQDYIHEIDNNGVRWPSIVLSGLDSIEARHDVQRIWPDDLIDAATGDTAVSLHEGASSGPCLMCFFPQNIGGFSSLEKLSERTGLPIEVLGRDEPLTEEEVMGLPEGKRASLIEHVGKPKCGLAQAFGLSDLNSAGYRPSIPFVSLQAACLGVGRLIATLTGIETGANFFQYDALLGPDPAAVEMRAASPTCYCGERRDLIERVRNSRRHVR